MHFSLQLVALTVRLLEEATVLLAICPQHKHQYLDYSGNFEVFRPIGVTRCTSGGGICHRLHGIFHPICAGVGVGPKNYGL